MTLPAAASLLALVLVKPVMSAAPEEGVGLSAALALSLEDNVFRLPEEGDADGEPPAGDLYRSASAGIHFNVPLSTQNLLGEAMVSDYHFERLERLDHDSWSARLAWLWRAGERLDGRMEYAAESSLASLANLQSGVQSSVPNHLRIDRRHFDIRYGPGARWQLRGTFDRLEHRNGAAEFASSDMRRDQIELSLAFVSTAGNQVGVTASTADARLPNPQIVAGTAVDNSHEQRRVAAFLDWAPTARSQFAVRAGHVVRAYRQSPQRDYSDWMSSLGYEWRPSERMSVTILAQRDLSESEQVNVGFVVTSRVALRPAVQLGARTHLAIVLESNDRRYRGDLALDAPGEVPALRERVRVIGLDLDYRVTTVLGLRLFARQDWRDTQGSLPGYRARIAGIELRALF